MKKPLSSTNNQKQTTLFKEEGLTEKQKALQILMFENSSAMKADKKKKYYKNKRK
jgi:hypothetical protein